MGTEVKWGWALAGKVLGKEDENTNAHLAKVTLAYCIPFPDE